jgi:hypothetical protein
VFQADLAFYLGQEPVDKAYVAGGLDLWYQYGVEITTRPFDYGNDILISIMGIKVVDAHAAYAAAPVERIQRVNDLAAGRNLRGRSDGILQVEEHMVNAERCGLCHHLVAGPGNCELATAQSRRSGFHVALLAQWAHGSYVCSVPPGMQVLTPCPLVPII